MNVCMAKECVSPLFDGVLLHVNVPLRVPVRQLTLTTL